MLKLMSQTDYDRSAIKAALRPTLSTAFAQQLAGKRRVLLKPNFVVPAAKTDPSTTHPDVYMAVAELLLEYNPQLQIGIGESPAFGSCASGLRAHGVLSECRERGIAVVEFKQPERYPGVSGDRAYAELTVAAELAAWDAVINLPKIKTHQQFTFTAASKNLYGCVTGKRKFIRHNRCANDPLRFARMILANAARVGCVLHIADGIEAMHVKGPRGGRSYPLGKLIVADDHLAHDWLVCRLLGLDPRGTPLFRALDGADQADVENTCAASIAAADFQVAEGFIHARLTPISFNPWRMARSGLRSLRYGLARA